MGFPWCVWGGACAPIASMVLPHGAAKGVYALPLLSWCCHVRDFVVLPYETHIVAPWHFDAIFGGASGVVYALRLLSWCRYMRDFVVLP